jgi:hypothetical protein
MDMPFWTSSDLIKIQKLQAALAGLPIEPGVWGAKGLDLLLTMTVAGPMLKQSARRVVEQKIKIYETNEARGVSAGWHENLSGERWITVDREMDRWFTIVGLGHETYHLQQDIRKRCSVEGEYEAWRFGYAVRAELSALGAVMPMLAEEHRLMSMPDAPTREDLREAQSLMKRIAAPGYLIDKAPLQGKDWPVGFIALAVKIINSVSRRGELI